VHRPYAESEFHLIERLGNKIICPFQVCYETRFIKPGYYDDRDVVTIFVNQCSMTLVQTFANAKKGPSYFGQTMAVRAPRKLLGHAPERVGYSGYTD
jgi:hypothetical protein